MQLCHGGHLRLVVIGMRLPDSATCSRGPEGAAVLKDHSRQSSREPKAFGALAMFTVLGAGATFGAPKQQPFRTFFLKPLVMIGFRQSPLLRTGERTTYR